MWQRFTETARKVIFYSQEEAQKFGEGYVSTEHLLLGLVREQCVATAVLAKMRISSNRVRAEVTKQLPRGHNRPSPDMTLTPRAKRTIDLAYVEAREFGDNYIGTEHLLLGMIHEGDGLAGRVLTKLGAELNMARAAVVAVRAEKGDNASERHSPLPNKRRTSPGFLAGPFLLEHILLSMIAEPGGRAAKAISAQCENVGFLQWTLWQQI